MSNDHPHYTRPEDRARPEDPAVFVSADADGTVALRVTESHALPREAFEGLLRFVDLRHGRMEVSNGAFADGRRWWQVAVFWESMCDGNRKIYAEDASFDGACVLCRGLLAHALASGVATP